MAPKFAKGKGVAKGAGTMEPPESALSGDRTKSAFFFPLMVDVQELRASFRPLWGAKTGGTKISIGANALENCINLRSVIINSQVTKIGNATFKNCKKLASMLVKTLKLRTVGNKALQGVSNCKISVPTIRLKKYRTLFTNKGQGKKVVIAKV